MLAKFKIANPARLKQDLLTRALWLGDFLRFGAERFAADRSLQVAAALAYTSLLSLVPLMAVAFSMLAAFPGFTSIGSDIQDFVFSNFVPAAGEVVQDHLQDFAEKASRLTSVGVLVLLVTALMMMSTIDKALNDIWRTRGRRSGLARFMVYWAVLTLGPVLVGTGLVATSYLSSLPLLADVETAGLDIRKTLLVWAPFISTGLAFTLLYVLVPSRNVPLRPAIIGGLVAAVLFETAKRGFAWWVTQFPTYEAIYGALASIPIFLVWIYLSWLIILLGAEVAHSLVIFHDPKFRGRSARRDDGLITTLRLVGHLWTAQQAGEGLSEEQLIKYEPGLDEDALGGILEDLEEARIVHNTASGDWVLARDASRLTVLGLYREVPVPLPRLAGDPESEPDPWNRAIYRRLGQVQDGLETAFDVSIAELFAKEPLPYSARLTEQAGDGNAETTVDLDLQRSAKR